MHQSILVDCGKIQSNSKLLTVVSTAKSAKTQITWSNQYTSNDKDNNPDNA